MVALRCAMSRRLLLDTVGMSSGPPSDLSTPKPRANRRDAIRNRELVVRASLEVFSERGALGTVGEVAERAGVGRATVYRSFPTREALMTAIGVQQLSELGDVAARCLAAPTEPGAGLIDYVYQLFAYNRVNRLYLELFRGELNAEVRRARDAIRVVVAELIVQARDRGLVRSDVIDDDFNALAGGLSVQLSLDPAATPAHWRRAPRLVLLALGVPDRLANRCAGHNPCA
jgi:AcrR family transcriptional regulator